MTDDPRARLRPNAAELQLMALAERLRAAAWTSASDQRAVDRYRAVCETLNDITRERFGDDYLRR